MRGSSAFLYSSSYGPTNFHKIDIYAIFSKGTLEKHDVYVKLLSYQFLLQFGEKAMFFSIKKGCRSGEYPSFKKLQHKHNGYVVCGA